MVTYYSQKYQAGVYLRLKQHFQLLCKAMWFINPVPVQSFYIRYTCISFVCVILAGSLEKKKKNWSGLKRAVLETRFS